MLQRVTLLESQSSNRLPITKSEINKEDLNNGEMSFELFAPKQYSFNIPHNKYNMTHTHTNFKLYIIQMPDSFRLWMIMALHNICCLWASRLIAVSLSIHKILVKKFTRYFAPRLPFVILTSPDPLSTFKHPLLVIISLRYRRCYYILLAFVGRSTSVIPT